MATVQQPPLLAPIPHLHWDVGITDNESAAAAETYYNYATLMGSVDTSCQSGEVRNTPSLLIVPPLYINSAIPSSLESVSSGSSLQTSPSSYQLSPTSDFFHTSPGDLLPSPIVDIPFPSHIDQFDQHHYQNCPSALGFDPSTDASRLSDAAPVRQQHQIMPPPPDDVVSVSSTFYPGANNDSARANLILISSDQVLFYVHYQRLNAASDNAFRGYFLSPDFPIPSPDGGPESIISVHESAPVLNVILHAVYNLSCGHYNHPFETLAVAVRLFPVYGLAPQQHLGQNSLLYPVLLAHATTHAIDLYILAAEHDLIPLATATSQYLLSHPLSSITDDMARQMGPVYLKKLFFLHLGRMDALKRLLLLPLEPHGPTEECDFNRQKEVARAWALGTSYLAYDARPDMPTTTIEGALGPLSQKISCDACRDLVSEKVQNLMVQWSCIKRTI